MKGTICRTNNGETVRSLYEKDVADFLGEHEIKYIYEPKYYFTTTGETVKPDFFLPDYNIYIEIWGMASDPIYTRRMYWKKNRYKMEDILLIELWPGGGRLNFRFFIKKHFESITQEKFPAKKAVPYFRPKARTQTGNHNSKN